MVMHIFTSLRTRFLGLYERFGLAHVKQTCFWTHVPYFSVSRLRATRYTLLFVFRHTPDHHTLRSLLRFCNILLVNLPPDCIWNMVHNRSIFCSSEANTCKSMFLAGRPQRGPPGAPLAGHSHLPSEGRGRSVAATANAKSGSSVLAHNAGSTYCTG